MIAISAIVAAALVMVFSTGCKFLLCDDCKWEFAADSNQTYLMSMMGEAHSVYMKR